MKQSKAKKRELFNQVVKGVNASINSGIWTNKNYPVTSPLLFKWRMYKILVLK